MTAQDVADIIKNLAVLIPVAITASRFGWKFVDWLFGD